MTRPLLEMNAASLYAGSKKLCEKLSFSMMAGDLICLLGRNGSGKTTLLKILAGLRALQQGEVLLKGEKLTQLSHRDKARRIALLLTSRMADESLRGLEYVSIGRWPHTPWHGKLSALDWNKVKASMHKTETDSLEKQPLHQLSDGEKQKLGIARILAQETEILLLDEPLSHLDAPSQIQILELMHQCTSQDGYAILFSCHDLNLAFRSCDKCLVMLAEGKWFFGSPAEVVADKDCRIQLGLDSTIWLQDWKGRK